jgi:hypothetical protein
MSPIPCRLMHPCSYLTAAGQAQKKARKMPPFGDMDRAFYL